MFEEAKAVIKVQECYLEGAEPDMAEHDCRIIMCDPERDAIKLVLEEDDLTKISLDSIYTCRIRQEEDLYCSIVIRERYLDERGCVLCARICDGFTKKMKDC